ncbi:NmrA/HSCARG family protein [Microbispora bryophytorum]|uniref:NmrA family transcriptional regulator n=1 Tax=Microbispora bryophytorum TaxID=1460882 RepID=A0A8H9GV76_9ACTN|nr:NmrA/HSCARG family protein [Microbispora bryophytorum]MBD3139627.1 NmrA/HSCARG family protein [Microbispora bryophytorum]TQS02912.1 NmrA/HSCARG family protein [Microbispora bryophytorum]GGO03012.1 NmrA family transcriptional regulator [Microbispora bryophytorum]
MATVLVIGATGKQGGAVAELLLDHGHDVTAYVRSPEAPSARALSAAGARLLPGDLADLEALASAARGVDAIFGLSIPFGSGGKDEEVAQGRLLIDVAMRAGAHLVYSSLRGADRLSATDIDHADSKQLVEAYLREQEIRATVLGPVYFMENVLNVGFSRLGDGVLANPLSAAKPLDQVTVRDIAGLAVHAIEHPDRFVGERIDVASDRVTGEEAARILSDILGREIPYYQLPLDQVRQWAGDEIADMFQRFEENTDFLDVDGLHATYPDVAWHSYADWARTVDWDAVLPSRTMAR